jgi:hypothetical protein
MNLDQLISNTKGSRTVVVVQYIQLTVSISIKMSALIIGSDYIPTPNIAYKMIQVSYWVSVSFV